MKNRLGWLGIDIGTHSIKLAQVRRVGRSDYQLVDAAVVQRQRPWQTNACAGSESTSSSGEIQAVLQAAVLCQGRRAACVPPMSYCQTRVIDRQPDESRPLGDELRDWISDDPQSYVVDYSPTNSQNRMMPAMLSAAWSQQISADVARAGLECQTIDVTPLALARAVALHREVTRGPVAAIDWGAHSATFVIVDRGSVDFVRQLPDVGCAQLAEAASSTLGLSLDEARMLLRTVGLPAADDRASSPCESTHGSHSQLLRDTISDALRRFIDEVMKTIDYLKSHQAALVPNQILLFGGGSTVPNIEDCLSQRLGLPCGVWQFSDQQPDWPQQLFGPAVALSTLSWSSS